MYHDSHSGLTPMVEIRRRTQIDRIATHMSALDRAAQIGGCRATGCLHIACTVPGAYATAARIASSLTDDALTLAWGWVISQPTPMLSTAAHR